MGNIYILFGVTTFVFVIGYGYIPSMPQQIQSFGIFIVFSIMILLFGLMFGIGLKLFNRSDKLSVIASILSSSLLIAMLFNVKGYLSYMYIPVLLYMIQNNVSMFIEKEKITKFIIIKKVSWFMTPFFNINHLMLIIFLDIH